MKMILLALVGVGFLILFGERAVPIAGPRVTPDAGDAPAKFRAVRALAFVEGKRLALNPLLLLGLTLSVLAMFAQGPWRILFLDDMGGGLLLFPLAGITLIASNVAVLRARRDNLEEQYGVLPVGPVARTLAHALALVVPVLYATLAITAKAIVSRALGGIGTPHVLELATGPALVACAGLVGILLARLVPRSVVALFMVVGIGFLEAGLSSRGSLKPLAPWMPTLLDPREIEVRPRGWHIVYLVGIAAVLLFAAILRHRRGARGVLALALSLTIAVLAGWAQYGAQTPRTDLRAAAWVSKPDAFQTCRHDGTVTFCAYDEYTALIPRWRVPVEGVLALLPPAVRARPLLVRQRLPASAVGSIRRDGVKRALPFPIPTDREFLWPDDGAVHPDVTVCRPTTEEECQTMLAASVAAWAVGFPLVRTKAAPFDQPPDEKARIPYGFDDSSGQARAVVALWLVLESTPQMRATPTDRRWQPDPTLSPFSLTPCQEGPPVVWSYTDTAYARRMAERPVAEVVARLASEWSIVTDPLTTTTKLAEMFDLQPPTVAMSAPPPFLTGC